jgi:cytochrome d ubiquinol oxidase subunit I
MLLGAYAWMMLRGKKAKVGTAKTTQYIMIRLAIASLVLVGCSAVMGDLSAKYIAKAEPTKLAAIELRDKTTKNAPLIFGGTAAEDGSARGGIKIPGMLSFLVGGSTNTVVKGLDQKPKSLWPLLIVHTLFDIKMVIAIILSVILVGFTAFYAKLKQVAFGKPMLVALVAAPFLSVALVELGWMVTELGRQPYAVYGYLLTSMSFTTSHSVMQLAWLFPAAYVALLIVTIWALLLTVKRFTASPERSKK